MLLMLLAMGEEEIMDRLSSWMGDHRMVCPGQFRQGLLRI
jgi:hypothetical protein